MRRTDTVRIRIAEDWGWHSIDYVTRGIPLLAFTRRRVHLDELRKIDIAG